MCSVNTKQKDNLYAYKDFYVSECLGEILGHIIYLGWLCSITNESERKLTVPEANQSSSKSKAEKGQTEHSKETSVSS